MVFVQHFARRDIDFEVISDYAYSLTWHDRGSNCVVLGSRGLLGNVEFRETFGNFFLTLVGNGSFFDPKTQHVVRLSRCGRIARVDALLIWQCEGTQSVAMGSSSWTASLYLPAILEGRWLLSRTSGRI